MPVHKVGKHKWQWGHQKVYRTKWQAARQGRAIAINEARHAGHHIPYPSTKSGVRKMQPRLR